MKKTILLSTCDQCHKEEMIEMPRKSERAQFVLPEGWIHIQGNTKTAEVFALDLCSDCVKPIRELAGKHKRL